MSGADHQECSTQRKVKLSFGETMTASACQLLGGRISLLEVNNLFWHTYRGQMQRHTLELYTRHDACAGVLFA